MTLCAAVTAGVMVLALAHRLRIPSIALLLLGGVALGPEGFGLVDPATLGSGLEVIVALAVAIILFEGGLTLDASGFRQEPVVISRMLTLGVAITWACGAGAAYAFADISGPMAIVAGSLVIVTGPTVVSPLLRGINVAPRLRHVLYWEAVLVDAVGVFVAVMCFEWLLSSADLPLAPLGRFVIRLAAGAGIGIGVGVAFSEVLRRRWVESDHANLLALGATFVSLGVANFVMPEAGILAVICAGLVVSLRRPPEIENIKRFDLQLTELAIAVLFVLLAAQLRLESFYEHRRELAAIVAVLVLVARPLNILISTAGHRFSWREKLFLAWLAPRGIVAASMASLFALRLSQRGYVEAPFLETMTYAVIFTTVMLQGLSAPIVARVLGLRRPRRGIWLLIGDPNLAVAIHQELTQAGARSLVIGTDKNLDALAKIGGDAVYENPLSPEYIRDPRVSEAEAVLALTGNSDFDARICEAWSSVLGPQACFRWSDDKGSGIPLAKGLPKPAEFTAGIVGGSLGLEALEVGDHGDTERFGSDLQPLLAIREGQVEALGHEVPSEAESVIAINRRIPGLYGLVQDALIKTRDASFSNVIDELLRMAARNQPQLDIEARRQEILEREATIPTPIGRGVAVPHVYDENVSRSAGYLAMVPAGLELSTPDNAPVKLVFLIISPKGKAQEHLMRLAAIARVAQDEQLLRVLTRQRTRGRLLTILRERE